MFLFCRSIEMACCLYKYYEDALGSLCTMIPEVVQCLLTVLLQCTIQSQPHPWRIQSAHLYQTLVELYNECLLHKPLVYIGIHCLNIREVINTTNIWAIFPEMWTCWVGWFTSKSTLHTRGQLREKFRSKALIDCSSQLQNVTYFNVSEKDSAHC